MSHRPTDRVLALAVGTRIRQRRQALGWTVQQLAASTGFCFTTLYGWEAGRCPPVAEALVRLSQALGVSTDWLLGLTDHTGQQQEAG